MAKSNHHPNSYRHLGKCVPSEDTKTIALVKYSYSLIAYCMKYSLSSLLNIAVSVELYAASAEVSLF